MTVPSTVDKVLRLQGRARLIGAALIPISVGLGLSALWPVGGLLWWATFALLLSLVAKVYSIFAMGIIAGILHDELHEEEDDDDGAVQMDEIELTIKDQGPVIGTFMDHEIHEWIEFADEANANKAFYVGTVAHPSDATNLPKYSIVMPGGIIYQFDMSQVEEQ